MYAQIILSILVINRRERVVLEDVTREDFFFFDRTVISMMNCKGEESG